ncbi:hypothetical protein ACIGKL_03465 [Pseudomonas sp. NPDC077186]|uniref:hypothetical protein n=1 Tax=Pseudomonas sp. NPDC077186 TaxID=3364421 RepID=UPI0037C507AC
MSWLNKIKNDAISSRLLDEQIYAQVLSEIENGQRRNGLWAKALAHSDGSNEKAKSLYIKYRADSIRDEIALAAKYKETEKDKYHAQENKSTVTPENWSENSETWDKSHAWINLLVFFIGAIFLAFIIGS